MTRSIEQMHPNSLEAYAELDLTERHQKILLCFIAVGHPMSDREVKNSLGYHDMNQVRPRITELVDMGALDEVGKIKCKVTKKNVRMCALGNPVDEIEVYTQQELI